MNHRINDRNYEEFFLLYVDGELSPDQRREVEAYLHAHPDLAAELQLLLETRLEGEAPESFGGKDSLLRPLSGKAMEETQEGWVEKMLLVLDGEMPAGQKEDFFKTLAEYPALRKEFEVLEKTRLRPDESLTFPDKQSLYRQAPRIRTMVYWSAAAVLLLIGWLAWLLVDRGPSGPAAASAPLSMHPKASLKNSTPPAVQGFAASPASLSTGPHHRTQTGEVLLKELRKGQTPSSPDEALADGRREWMVARTELAPVPEADPAVQKEIKVEESNPQPAVFATLASEAAPATDSSFRIAARYEPAPDWSAESGSRGSHRMRGFFRKVGRTLGKTTHLASDSQSPALLVGNFQIALK